MIPVKGKGEIEAWYVVAPSEPRRIPCRSRARVRPNGSSGPPGATKDGAQ